MISITANLKVDNVKETILFYKDVLGFEIVMTVPEYDQAKLNWGMVKNNEAVLMFQEKYNLEEEYPALKNNTGTGCLTLFIKVENIEEFYNNIKGKVNIIKDIHSTFYGTKEFAILDINNFILTFAE